MADCVQTGMARFGPLNAKAAQRNQRKYEAPFFTSGGSLSLRRFFSLHLVPTRVLTPPSTSLLSLVLRRCRGFSVRGLMSSHRRHLVLCVSHAKRLLSQSVFALCWPDAERLPFAAQCWVATLAKTVRVYLRGLDPVY